VRRDASIHELPRRYLLENWLRSSVFGEVCLFSIVFGALRPIVRTGESVAVRTLEAKKK
jgi:hypothetical protein